MRLLSASGILYGAALASAMTVPSRGKRGLFDDVIPNLTQGVKRVPKLVDLAPFEAGKFQLIPPEKAKADAEPGVVPSKSDAETPAAGSGMGTATAGTCTNPIIRPEWRRMTDDQRAAFIGAINCLMARPSAGGFPGSQNRYEDLVSLHQQKTNDIHMVGQFLPWHRYFIGVFETLLRQDCGYSGQMPWWDETLDAGNFAAAPVFTDQYFGVAPLKTADGQGSCIETTGFGLNITLHIGPGGDITDHCLSRAVDESLTAQSNAGFVADCNSHAAYADMEPCAEMGPHAYGHNGIGAVMSDVSPSPGDPIFFLHHAFVDHNWRTWQAADLAGRLYQVGGYSDQGKTQALTLDYPLSSLGIWPDATVNDVMDTEGGYLCYRYDY